MSGFLLDANVLSELTRPQPDRRVVEWLNTIDESLLYLSVLTLGEIRKGLTILATGRRRSLLEAWLDTELAARFGGRVLPIDHAVADRWGRLAGEAARRCL
jgi:predicted nucleic acid-binding protein